MLQWVLLSFPSPCACSSSGSCSSQAGRAAGWAKCGARKGPPWLEAGSRLLPAAATSASGHLCAAEVPAGRVELLWPHLPSVHPGSFFPSFPVFFSPHISSVQVQWGGKAATRFSTAPHWLQSLEQGWASIFDTSLLAQVEWDRDCYWWLVCHWCIQYLETYPNNWYVCPELTLK